MIDKKLLAQMQEEELNKSDINPTSIEDIMKKTGSSSLGSYDGTSASKTFGSFDGTHVEQLITSSQSSIGSYTGVTAADTVGAYKQNTESTVDFYMNKNILDAQTDYKQRVNMIRQIEPTSHINTDYVSSSTMTEYKNLSNLKWLDDASGAGKEIIKGSVEFAKQETLSGSEVGAAISTAEHYVAPVAKIVLHRLQAIENFGLMIYQENNKKLMMAKENLLEAGGIKGMSDNTYKEFSELLTKDTLNNRESARMQQMIQQYIRQQGGSVGRNSHGYMQTELLKMQAGILNKRGKVSSQTKDMLTIFAEQKKFFQVPGLRSELKMIAGFGSKEVSKVFKDNDIFQTYEFMSRIYRHARQAYKVGVSLANTASRAALWATKKIAILAAKTRLAQAMEAAAKRVAATKVGSKVVKTGKAVKTGATKVKKANKKIGDIKYKYSFKGIRDRLMKNALKKLAKKFEGKLIGKIIGQIANLIAKVAGAIASACSVLAIIIVVVLIVMIIIMVIVEKFNLAVLFGSCDDPMISKDAMKSIEITLQRAYEAEMTTYYQLGKDYESYVVVYDNDTNRDVEKYTKAGIDINEYVPDSNNEELVAMTMAYSNYKIIGGLFGNSTKATTFLENAYRASHADYSYEKSPGGSKLIITVRPYYLNKLFDLDFSSVPYVDIQYTQSQIETAEMLWDMLDEAGYNDVMKAAALGNMQKESGLNPAAQEGAGGCGLGLIQISNVSGNEQLYAEFQSQFATLGTDPVAQMDWILDNWRANGTSLRTAMENAQSSRTTIQSATDWWYGNVEFRDNRTCQQYEGYVYEGYGYPVVLHEAIRYSYAQNWYNLLHEN